MKDLQSVIDLVKDTVSLGELLVRRGKIRGSLPEEQFSCMFHGADRKKSCRYYKETDTAYCWVCKEKWDIISFTQRLEGINFSQSINHLVKTHRIDLSKLPDVVEAEQARIINKKTVKVDQKKLALENLLHVINLSKNTVAAEPYDRFVYSFMMLKYVVSDDKFKEIYVKLREAIDRVAKK